MIYETAVVLRADSNEEVVAKVKAMIEAVIAEGKGEILLKDDWGTKVFAQPTQSGLRNGKFIYFMFKADGSFNNELERRFKINEDMIRSILVKLGEDKNQAIILKNYKNVNTREDLGEDEFGEDKDKRLYSKRKSCYFSATKTQPDWKNPESYQWLVNEFGKISPARITGLRPKYQRMATAAIKRARNMGLISHLSNDVAY
jgi:ribosomal protein S18/ribosomal protein S6